MTVRETREKVESPKISSEKKKVMIGETHTALTSLESIKKQDTGTKEATKESEAAKLGQVQQKQGEKEPQKSIKRYKLSE